MTYIETNELNYELNERDFTAKVVFSENSCNDVLIPYSITHLNYVYVITCIGKESFHRNKNIRSVIFPENTRVQKIEDNAFQFSSIEKIIIPPTVTEFGNNVFEFCKNLQTIKFPPNSPLSSLGKSTFSNTILDSFEVPSKVTTLQNCTFNTCEKLKSVTFAPNSQLEKIEDNAISYCPIECITIPQKVTTIEDSWFISLTKVKKFSISPENANFSVYNDQIMVRKTDPKSDIFDIFMMSIRNIEKVIVPSYIKRISSSCFADCCSLESIEFSNDSKIESIGSRAFYRCPIRSFVIPSSVVDLGEGILSDCKRLKFVEFQSNSKLCSIRNNAFYNSVFKGIIVPSSVNCIYCQAFADC